MAKRIVFLLIALASLSLTFNVQITQTIRGVVTDAITSEQLPFATIQEEDKKDKNCVTDNLGTYPG